MKRTDSFPALSPLDGRYAAALDPLRLYFSEDALFGARVEVEIRYLIALSRVKKVKELRSITSSQEKALMTIIAKFSAKDAAAIRGFERVTRHDVKAMEYWLKQKVQKIPGLKKSMEFVHFGLTSEDVNNLAYGILIHRAIKNVILPGVQDVVRELLRLGKSVKDIPMLSLTHGQPATPTTIEKEMMVFVERLSYQWDQLRHFSMMGKFGGAVGNFSAHKAAYPDVQWDGLKGFATTFVKSLGFRFRLNYTTQINPHDDIAELSHNMTRINTILLDASRDFWMYISRGIFRQKVIAGEVGSSAMPHKVNPIDFENAEGNVGLSSALFNHFAEKLPVSRLQRDLSDSTVQRSIGSAFGYHYLAVKSFLRGLSKISVDASAVQRELRAHPEVIAEAIQTILRKNGVDGAYEKLKALTRGEHVTVESLRAYIQQLQLPKAEKQRLLDMLP